MKIKLASLFFALLLLGGFFQASLVKAEAASDLIPTDFQLTDSTGTSKNTFKIGERIYVKVTITNNGTTSADSGTGQTIEAFYRNFQGTTSVTCQTPADPSGLYLVNGAFGASATYEYGSFPNGPKASLFTNQTSWTGDTPGTYKAVVFVDYNCQITEANENNNQASFTYTIASDTPPSSPAQTTSSDQAAPLSATSGTPPEGSWVIDPEVTRIGKNASRSGMLLDWTLRDYQWASSSAQQVGNSPLASFWLVIQRIVYSLFLVVILITAFVLIITRGRSLSAKRFLPRFFLAVLLVTFSFSLIQFIYQFTDIIQGFFLKNPQGAIISSKDLLFIGFNYTDFQGLRRIGLPFEESAFMSLILVKFTSFTYYVMALLLLFRKILLWFFIILSPIFPILLLFYPVRNTGKIWIGEFFRWVMYAPLFAVFLSGLVKLWQSGLPLIFDFSGVARQDSIYPTAVNILLGGPGQRIGINNSVNLPDTFALYMVALIMLWAAIILPFILLQIFLDHMLSFNYQESPMVKQMMTVLNNRMVPPPKPIGPVTPIGPSQSTGMARNLPFGRNFALPKTTGLTKEIPASRSQQQSVQRPTTTRISNQSSISRLTNLSIPTMKDIARFETTKLSNDVRTSQEITRVSQVLSMIANPTSTSSVTERDRYRMIREQLVTEGQRGNQVAKTVLNAATTYKVYANQNQTVENKTSQFIQTISNPSTVVNQAQKEKIVHIKDQIVDAAKSGNILAQSVLNAVTTVTNKQFTQLQTLLKNLNQTTTTNSAEKQSYQQLREKIIASSKSGNSLASLLLTSMEKATSVEDVKQIHEKLIEAKDQGSPLAAEILQTVEKKTKLDQKETEQIQTKLKEAEKKGDPLATVLLQALNAQTQSQVQTHAPVSAQTKLKTGNFPVVNRIQQVSFDDYESVRKMWKENYHNLDVPQSLSGQRTRREWITEDINDIEQTISLLSSTDAQKVEEGMQKVSDILPFLLIGGFSQTEIIAYLKAKSEAGKATLEELTQKDDEQEQFIEAEHAARQATGQMSMAASVERPMTASVTTNNATTITNNYQVDKSSPISAIKEAIVNPQQGSTLLKLAELPLLTMKDIVRLESSTMHTSETSSNTNEREKIATTLQMIARPATATSADREKFTQLHDELIRQSQQGNELAQMILSATKVISQSAAELSQKDTLGFVQLLDAVNMPEHAEAEGKTDIISVNQQLLRSREKADTFAKDVLKVTEAVQTFVSDRTKDFLVKVSNPSALPTAASQMQFTKLVEKLALASEDGNKTASSLLALTREGITDQTISKVFTTLSSATIQGDPLATYITSTLYSLPQELNLQVNTLYQTLLKEKDKDNSFALALLKIFTKRQRVTQQKSAAKMRLPKVNRLQQVTLDDYEAVKKMWIENYTKAEVPLDDQGKPQTRDAWIQHDITLINEVINLLSSTEEDRVSEGMDKVGGILPFLLLGGFTLTEIIGYLRAKLEAAKQVLQVLQLENEKDQQFIVEKVPSTAVSTHSQEVEMVLPTTQKTSALVGNTTSTEKNDNQKDEH